MCENIVTRLVQAGRTAPRHGARVDQLLDAVAQGERRAGDEYAEGRDQLVISQRTAEAHVERIVAKLGFTSRAQVAAWVTVIAVLAMAVLAVAVIALSRTAPKDLNPTADA